MLTESNILSFVRGSQARSPTPQPDDDQGSVTVTDTGDMILYNHSVRGRTMRVGQKRKTLGHAPVTDLVASAVLDLVDLDIRKNKPKIKPKCPDPDELFLQFCLGPLKDLPKIAKYEAKIEIILFRKKLCCYKPNKWQLSPANHFQPAPLSYNLDLLCPLHAQHQCRCSTLQTSPKPPCTHLQIQTLPLHLELL